VTGHELVALERAGWQALVDGTAATFYRDVLAPDALLVVPGMVIDGSAWLDSLTGPQWSSFEIEDTRVVDLADDAAAVVYHAIAQRGDDPPYQAFVTSTYRRAGDRWQLALHQQTPDPSSAS